jgi:hypothetical protein
VIEKIKISTAGVEKEVGRRFDQFVAGVKALKSFISLAQSLGLDVGRLETLVNFLDPFLKADDEEFFRAALTDVVSLAKLALDFNPGTLEDSPKNRFVYTCKCGWIDIGHFFFSATAAYGAGLVLLALETQKGDPKGILALLKKNVPVQIALALGVAVEVIQELVRQIDIMLRLLNLRDLLPPGVKSAIDGLAHSAFAIEDLPSDKFGAEFGQELFKKLLVSKASPLSLGASPSDIPTEMENEFFANCNPVKPSGTTLDAMMNETICVDPAGQPDTCERRQHFTTDPVLLNSAKPLCPSSPAVVPPPAPPPAARDPVTILFEKDAPQSWFDPATSFRVSVTDVGKERFDALVDTLTAQPKLKVQLAGNASIEKPADDFSYNQRLSLRRVKLIERELAKRGIDATTRVADPPNAATPTGCEELRDGLHACGDTGAQPATNPDDRNVKARVF